LCSQSKNFKVTKSKEWNWKKKKFFRQI
jgi:hypothetical protein